MLNLYFENNSISQEELLKQANLKRIITDIDGEFNKIRLTGSPEEIKAIECIDKGKYHSQTEFVDRWDAINEIGHLSTGCKAMILVSRLKDYLVDISSCGFNARDLIFHTLKNGNILLSDPGITIESINAPKVNIQLDGYRFTSIDRLNWYIFNERPFTPNMQMEGIEWVEG